MKRNLWGLMGVVWIAGLLGCSMCQKTYDYCAATIGPDGKPTGGFMTRQGSVLGGMPGVPVYQSQPTPADPSGASPPRAEPMSSQPTAGQGEVVPVSAEAPVEGDAPDEVKGDAH
jgi:hypothetical protein